MVTVTANVEASVSTILGLVSAYNGDVSMLNLFRLGLSFVWFINTTSIVNNENKSTEKEFIDEDNDDLSSNASDDEVSDDEVSEDDSYNGESYNSNLEDDDEEEITMVYPRGRTHSSSYNSYVSTPVPMNDPSYMKETLDNLKSGKSISPVNDPGMASSIKAEYLS